MFGGAMRDASDSILKEGADGRRFAAFISYCHAEAAMALKARNTKMWIEPLGELPEAGGATSLYAIALI